MRCPLMILVVAFLSLSCEEQFSNDDNEVPQKTLDVSLQLFDGTISEHNSIVEDGIEVWKIKIQNEAGAVVSFYWQKSYYNLYKIEGEHGPFTYDIQPPLNVLPLSTARFLAFESYSMEKLKSWTLNRSNKFDNRWIYQFFIRGIESPLRIDATSGDALHG